MNSILEDLLVERSHLERLIEVAKENQALAVVGRHDAISICTGMTQQLGIYVNKLNQKVQIINLQIDKELLVVKQAKVNDWLARVSDLEDMMTDI